MFLILWASLEARMTQAYSADLRSRVIRARTVDKLWTTIGQSLLAFSPAECANYFKAAGYEPD